MQPDVCELMNVLFKYDSKQFYNLRDYLIDPKNRYSSKQKIKQWMNGTVDELLDYFETSYETVEDMERHLPYMNGH